MIWKTTNALGQEVVWYSDDEYNTLLISLFVMQELLELYDNGTHIDRSLNKIDEEENENQTRNWRKT